MHLELFLASPHGCPLKCNCVKVAKTTAKKCSSPFIIDLRTG